MPFYGQPARWTGPATSGSSQTPEQRGQRALGYLLKGALKGALKVALKVALKAEILRAIRGVASGEAIFGPAIAQRLIHYFSGLPQVAPPQLFPELTDREREILALIAQHRTNSEIADRLSIAPKTVRNHVSNIFSKLQVVDRAQAIMRARDAGLGQEWP